MAVLMLTACNCNKCKNTAEQSNVEGTETTRTLSQEESIKAGVNAPSGQNKQSYEIRVINSPELINNISSEIVKEMPQAAEREGFKNIFVNAPCVLFIANKTEYRFSQIDCGLLSQNIQLAAWARGIGSCCLGMPVILFEQTQSGKKVVENLEFSDGYQLVLCIALGYPNETPDPRPRKTDMIKYIE